VLHISLISTHYKQAVRVETHYVPAPLPSPVGAQAPARPRADAT